MAATNFTFTPAATLSISGVTPAAGPTFTDKVNAAYTGFPTNADDRLNGTYTINANTIATSVGLGLISAGLCLWIQCDGPLAVTLIQPSGTSTFRVDSFLLLQSAFTSLSLANPSATTAVHVSIVAAGTRPAVGGGPGIF